MRWPTFESKIDAWNLKRKVWRRWYAWYPVILTGYENLHDNRSQWTCFETIERKIDGVGNWTYRIKREDEIE